MAAPEAQVLRVLARPQLEHLARTSTGGGAGRPHRRRSDPRRTASVLDAVEQTRGEKIDWPRGHKRARRTTPRSTNRVERNAWAAPAPAGRWPPSTPSCASSRPTAPRTETRPPLSRRGGEGLGQEVVLPAVEPVLVEDDGELLATVLVRHHADPARAAVPLAPDRDGAPYSSPWSAPRLSLLEGLGAVVPDEGRVRSARSAAPRPPSSRARASRGPRRRGAGSPGPAGSCRRRRSSRRASTSARSRRPAPSACRRRRARRPCSGCTWSRGGLAPPTPHAAPTPHRQRSEVAACYFNAVSAAPNRSLAPMRSYLAAMRYSSCYFEALLMALPSKLKPARNPPKSPKCMVFVCFFPRARRVSDNVFSLTAARPSGP